MQKTAATNTNSTVGTTVEARVEAARRATDFKLGLASLAGGHKLQCATSNTDQDKDMAGKTKCTGSDITVVTYYTCTWYCCCCQWYNFSATVSVPWTWA